MKKKKREIGEDGLVVRDNKEELKRERNEIRDFAEEILKLPNTKYRELPIDEELYKALIEGKRLARNAYSRHLSYLARLIHEQGFDEIQAAYHKAHHPYRNDTSKIKQTENYRHRLMDNDKAVINELDDKFLGIDIQYLRQLARNAKKERLKQDQENIQAEALGNKPNHKPTKSEKVLYQFLFTLVLR